MTTHERPDVPAGTVLRLQADDWKLGTARPGPLLLRVERVRWDLFSRLWSGGYVWVQGWQLRSSDRMPFGHVEVSVLYGALTERQEGLMTTTYPASAALDQIDAAQATLDAHPTTMDGICRHCRTATCVRLDALTTLTRYGRLPRRRPGAGIPHPTERPPGAYRWFRRASQEERSDVPQVQLQR